jgi:hypothetical protein
LLLSQDEVASMLALLKGQELPPKVQTTSPSTWDKDSAKDGIKELRRSRMDPAALLLEQVSMPVMSLPSNKSIKVCIVKWTF